MIFADLELLEFLDSVATPAPWANGKVGCCVTANTPVHPSDDSASFEYYGGGLVAESMTAHNRALVIAIRNALPSLIQELRELRKTRAEIMATLARYGS